MGQLLTHGPTVVWTSGIGTSKRRTRKNKVRISVGHGIEHQDMGQGGLCALKSQFFYFYFLGLRNVTCREVEKAKSGKKIVFCNRTRKSEFFFGRRNSNNKIKRITATTLFKTTAILQKSCPVPSIMQEFSYYVLRRTAYVDIGIPILPMWTLNFRKIK